MRLKVSNNPCPVHAGTDSSFSVALTGITKIWTVGLQRSKHTEVTAFCFVQFFSVWLVSEEELDWDIKGKKVPWMCRWVWMMEIQRVGIKAEDQRHRVRGRDEWEDGVKTASFVCSWLLKRRLILQSELQRCKSEACKQDYPSHPLSLSSMNTHSHTHCPLADL